MTEEQEIKAREKSPGEGQTEGVRILLGEPKKATIKLAIPMIVAMSATTIYYLTDAFWVSGLGTFALAAVNFFFPFMTMIMAFSIGLGVGGGAAISRRIGAKDPRGADNVAAHTIVFMVIIAALFSIPFLIFAENIFRGIGAGEAAEMATAYARIMFGGTLIIFFMFVATAILRAEGDVKRAMYAMMLGAGLNIILDPIFIYTFELGVPGAAWATLLSYSISSIMLFIWLFVRKDTFVNFRFRGFRFDRKISLDIFRVGLPSMVMQLSMAISMFFMNLILVHVAGEDGVAVFGTGWRVSMVAILPLLGISTAVVSVTGAAYGARDYQKLKTSLFYAVKIGIMIEVVAAVLTFVFAPQITAVFTTSEDTTRIADDLTNYFRIIAIFYPGVAFGMFSSSMFQGTGKGLYALIVTIVRTLVLGTPLAAFFAITFDMGLTGVWWGMVIGNLLGSFIAFTWANLYLRKLVHSG